MAKKNPSEKSGGFFMYINCDLYHSITGMEITAAESSPLYTLFSH